MRGRPPSTLDIRRGFLLQTLQLLGHPTPLIWRGMPGLAATTKYFSETRLRPASQWIKHLLQAEGPGFESGGSIRKSLIRSYPSPSADVEVERVTTRPTEPRESPTTHSPASSPRSTLLAYMRPPATASKQLVDHLQHSTRSAAAEVVDAWSCVFEQDAQAAAASCTSEIVAPFVEVPDLEICGPPLRIVPAMSGDGRHGVVSARSG